MLDKFLKTSHLLILPLMLLAFINSSVQAGEIEDIEPFFGEFEGQAISSEDEASMRMARVKLTKTGKDSFHLDWETTVHKTDGREKVNLQSVEFQSSEREGIFGSAMRKNMFGKWEPLNPLQGDPYIWAKVEEGTLIVYAMVITEEGGYEMQQYNRRMIDKDTMDLVFYRIRNGVQLKAIRGHLKRISN